LETGGAELATEDAGESKSAATGGRSMTTPLALAAWPSVPVTKQISQSIREVRSPSWLWLRSTPCPKRRNAENNHASPIPANRVSVNLERAEVMEARRLRSPLSLFTRLARFITVIIGLIFVSTRLL